MKFTKTLLTFLFLLCLLCSIFTLPSFAEVIDSGSCGPNATWSFDKNGGILTITGTGAMDNYTSSSQIPWYMSYRTMIYEVVIEEGITQIGSRAFYGLSRLNSVSISKSVHTIESYAFANCSLLSDINLHDGITTIGTYAFQNCRALTELTLPSKLTTIPMRAFYGCKGLERVTLPPALTGIGDRAFYNCTNLLTIYNHSNLILTAGNTNYGYISYYATEIYGHNWDSGVTVQHATHNQNGQINYTCNGCKTIRTETIDKIPHRYTTWKNANDNFHQSICECGDITQQEHIWGNAKTSLAATHTTPGVRILTCSICLAATTQTIPTLSTHEYNIYTQQDETNHMIACACGDAQLQKHCWDTGKIANQPTHITDGVKHQTCTECGFVYITVIPKTSHVYMDWESLGNTNHQKSCACGDVISAPHRWQGIVITSPTNTQMGERRFTCSDCNASYTEVISKLQNNENEEAVTSYVISISPNGGSSSDANVIIKDANGNIINGSNVYTMDGNGQMAQVFNSETSEELELSSCRSSLSGTAFPLLMLALATSLIILKKKRA